MLSLSPAELAHLAARKPVRTRFLIWVTAKSFSTGAIEEMGLWTGDDHQAFMVDGIARDYFGAGNILEIDGISRAASLEVRMHQIKLSPLSPEVITLIRGYDVRLAPVLIHRARFDPETNALLAPPFRIFKGWVETISNIDDPSNENYRRGLAVIGTETDRLYTMVEELLDFSRMQNGIKMNCQVLDFVAEATDAALFVEARIRQEGMQLVYQEPPEPYPVWADPARLRQVFVNLFDNAIKYSEPGGTIFLTLRRTPVTVSASIRDQGRGIAPDDLEKVKQRFFKAKNSVRGSGIGLAVVDEIVQTLGGRFDITSTLGCGTTVTVTLPVYHPGQEHLHEKI